MFHRIFPSYTTHLFHHDSLSPDHFLLYYPFVSLQNVSPCLSLIYYPFVSPILFPYIFFFLFHQIIP